MSSPAKNLKIVILASSYSHSYVVINSLQKVADTFTIRIENDARRMKEGRLNRHGVVKGIGQKLFIKFSKKLYTQNQDRIQEIIETYNLDRSPKAPDVSIPDIHDGKLIETIQEQKPDMIILNCFSIIPKHVIDSINLPIINIHAGITPMYRGLFGAYWALRDGNEHLIGSTIHLVDAGIDTGNILKQVYFTITADDNFASYSFLHMAHSLSGLHETIDYYLEHNCLPDPIESTLPSKIRSHPTLFGYLFHRVFRGIR